jgi:hypothetical protein
MNVLDRADKPWTMLKQIRSMLHPENVSVYFCTKPIIPASNVAL